MSTQTLTAAPTGAPSRVDARYLLGLSALTLCYFAGAKLGLSLAFTTKQVTAVWPPTGIAVAALTLWGSRVWPALFLGALWANATANESLLTALGIAVGNTVGPVASVWALRRFGRADGALATFRDVFGLTLIAVLGMTISASNGVVQLGLGGLVPWANVGKVWWVWWLGDAMGVLLFAPFLLTALVGQRARWSLARVVEALALLLMLLLVSTEAFSSGLFRKNPSDYPLQYAVFPFVMWAALRFGPRETAAAVLLISTVAVHATANHRGPLAGPKLNPDEQLLLLELFMSAVALTGLTLAAAVAERGKAERELRLANDELEARVAARTEELASANTELSAKNEEIESFVYIVSHDLRGPLVNLQGFSKELTTSCRELGDKLQVSNAAALNADVRFILEQDVPSSLRYISASATKLQRLTDALILLSRSGRQDYAKEPVDVKTVVEATLDAMQGSIQRSGASVTVGDLPAALGDATALGQVFANLLANAVKYADPARPLRIEVHGAVEDGFAHYRVHDNGSGIPESAAHRVFQVFQRFHPELAPGEGMGLAIVKRVTQRHGGKVWMESEVGVGTTFHVSVPAAPLGRAA